MELDITKIHYREISGRGEAYDHLKEARRKFEVRLRSDAATLEDILSFVLLIDHTGYETIPQSVGMQWLGKNPQRFQEIVGDVDAFIEAVYEMVENYKDQDNEHGSTATGLKHWFFSLLLNYHQLMILLSPTWRELYISEIYTTCGSCNSSWITNAVMLGIPRRTIAKAIYDRLVNTEVDPRYNTHTSFHDFLQHGRTTDSTPTLITLRNLGGGGLNPWKDKSWEENIEAFRKNPVYRFEEIEEIVARRNKAVAEGKTFPVTHDPYWASGRDRSPEAMWRRHFESFKPWDIMSNEELFEALSVCAEKVPSATIAQMDNIKARLGETSTAAIMTKAVEGTNSLGRISDHVLKSLPFPTRKRLVERLKPPKYHYEEKSIAQFVFTILTELPKRDREEFWGKTIEPLVKKIKAPILYKAWRQLDLEEKDVEITLRRRLDAEGYLMGNITMGRHPKGGIQWGVKIGRTLYVKSRDQHRYFPKEGDPVMFRQKGFQLTPYVMAVNFIPVMKDIDN